MTRSVQPLLASDFQPLIVRAHRERGTVMAGLLRNVANWLSHAALQRI